MNGFDQAFVFLGNVELWPRPVRMQPSITRATGLSMRAKYEWLSGSYHTFV